MVDEPRLNPQIKLAHLLLLFARDKIQEGRIDKAQKLIDMAIEELGEYLEQEAKDIASTL